MVIIKSKLIKSLSCLPIFYFLIMGVAFPASLTLNGTKNKYSVNEKIMVSITAKDVIQPIILAEVVIKYDPLILKLNVINSSQSKMNHKLELPRYLIRSINNNTGEARLVLAHTIPGIKGESLFITNLNFVSISAGKTEIKIAIDTVNGSSLSGLITDDDNFTNQLTRVNNLSLDIENTGRFR